MQSRLLTTLLGQARSADNQVDWAREVCRAAGHMARAGQVEPALEQIAQVRAVFGPGLHPRVASWLMLAEGIRHWCKFEVTQGYDRILRAHALAIAFKQPAAQAASAAWMALIEFNRGQYAKMAEHLTQTFTLAAPDDHQARARATLILADIYHAAGDYERARPWYEQARRHAVAVGDEATLGAMLYNIAINRLGNLRIADAFGEVNPQDLWRVGIETSNSLGFDRISHNDIQDSWRKLLKARNLLLAKKYADAIPVFESIREPMMDYEKVRPVIAIDLAWCHVQLGRPDNAKPLYDEAKMCAALVSDPDDQAYIYRRLSVIASKFGDRSSKDKFNTRAKACLEEHRRFQQELASIGDRIPAVPMQ